MLYVPTSSSTENRPPIGVTVTPGQPTFSYSTKKGTADEQIEQSEAENGCGIRSEQRLKLLRNEPITGSNNYGLYYLYPVVTEAVLRRASSRLSRYTTSSRNTNSKP